MSTVTCATCMHATSSEHPGTRDGKAASAAARMHALGLVRCLKGPHYLFMSPRRQRECPNHQRKP